MYCAVLDDSTNFSEFYKLTYVVHGCSYCAVKGETWAQRGGFLPKGTVSEMDLIKPRSAGCSSLRKFPLPDFP